MDAKSVIGRASVKRERVGTVEPETVDVVERVTCRLVEKGQKNSSHVGFLNSPLSHPHDW